MRHMSLPVPGTDSLAGTAGVSRPWEPNAMGETSQFVWGMPGAAAARHACDRARGAPRDDNGWGTASQSNRACSFACDPENASIDCAACSIENDSLALVSSATSVKRTPLASYRSAAPSTGAGNAASRSLAPSTSFASRGSAGARSRTSAFPGPTDTCSPTAGPVASAPTFPIATLRAAASRARRACAVPIARGRRGLTRWTRDQIGSIAMSPITTP